MVVVRLGGFGLSWCCLFGRFWVVIILSTWSVWVVTVLSVWSILGCHGVVCLICMGDFGLLWRCLFGRMLVVMVLSRCYLFGRFWVVMGLSVWSALVVLGCYGVVCLVSFELLLWYCLFGLLVFLGCYGIICLVDFGLSWCCLFGPFGWFRLSRYSVYILNIII